MSGLSQDTYSLRYGWPSLAVSAAEIGQMETKLKKEHKAIPIFMEEELTCMHALQWILK
jgi:hypothetical protein